MFERYTDRARRSVELAQEYAAALGHDTVGTEHLLLGLLNEGGGVAFTALDALGVTVDTAGEAVRRRRRPGNGRTGGHIPFTPQFKKTTEVALREALQLGCNFVGTEHLLLGLIREAENVGALALADCGMTGGDRGFLTDVRRKVLELLHGYARNEHAVAQVKAAEAADRASERQAFAWELVSRMRKFLGHIEDMKDDERVFMLGALTGTLEGMLQDNGVPEAPAKAAD